MAIVAAYAEDRRRADRIRRRVIVVWARPAVGPYPLSDFSSKTLPPLVNSLEIGKTGGGDLLVLPRGHGEIPRRDHAESMGISFKKK
jgi:hypothetical protein